MISWSSDPMQVEMSLRLGKGSAAAHTQCPVVWSICSSIHSVWRGQTKAFNIPSPSGLHGKSGAGDNNDTKSSHVKSERSPRKRIHWLDRTEQQREGERTTRPRVKRALERSLMQGSLRQPVRQHLAGGVASADAHPGAARCQTQLSTVTIPPWARLAQVRPNGAHIIFTPCTLHPSLFISLPPIFTAQPEPQV